MYHFALLARVTKLEIVTSGTQASILPALGTDWNTSYSICVRTELSTTPHFQIYFDSVHGPR